MPSYMLYAAVAVSWKHPMNSWYIMLVFIYQDCHCQTPCFQVEHPGWTWQRDDVLTAANDAVCFVAVKGAIGQHKWHEIVFDQSERGPAIRLCQQCHLVRTNIAALSAALLHVCISRWWRTMAPTGTRWATSKINTIFLLLLWASTPYQMVLLPTK